MERAQSASLRAVALAPDIPEVLVSQGWILYAGSRYDDAVRLTRAAISRKRDCEGAYYLLLRALFASGKYEELASLAEQAIEAAGTDYNVYIPLMNALGALGREEVSATRSGSGSSRPSKTTFAKCRRTRGPGSSAPACTPRKGATKRPSARRTWP